MLSKLLRNLVKAVGYLLAAMIAIELADKGLKAFIKAFDPYYQAILLSKKSTDRAAMGENVVVVLNKANSNGAGEVQTAS